MDMAAPRDGKGKHTGGCLCHVPHPQRPVVRAADYAPVGENIQPTDCGSVASELQLITQLNAGNLDPSPFG
jgi:hypothetical protein